MPEPNRMNDAATTWQGKEIAAVVSLWLVVLSARWWHIDFQCLSHDEVYEVQAIQQPFQEFVWEADGFPPLHRVMLWSVVRATQSELAGRWFALACGVLTVVGLVRCGSVIADRTTATAIGWLAAISPVLIYYSQESRAYGLYLAASAWCLRFFLQAMLQDDRRAWCGFVVTCLIGMLTHYYFALWLPIFGIAWLTSNARSGHWRSGLIAIGVLGLGLLAIIPLLRSDLLGTIRYPERTPFNAMALGYTFYSLLAGYDLGPSLSRLHEIRVETAILEFVPYILAMALIFGPLIVLGVRRLEQKDRRVLVVLLTLTAVPPLIAGGLARALQLNFHPRYVVTSSVPLLILAGAGLASLRSSRRKILTVVAITSLTGWGLVQRHYSDDHRNEDMRAVAEFLRERTTAERAKIYVNVGYMKRPLEYYLGPQWSCEEIPFRGDPNGIFSKAEDVDAWLATLPEETEIWIVITRPFHGDPNGALRYRMQDFFMFGPAAEFSGVLAYRRPR